MNSPRTSPDQGGPDVTEPAAGPAKPRRNPIDTALPLLAGLLLVAMLIFCVFLIQKKSEISQAGDLRGCFLAGAERTASEMANMSADNIDEQIQAILDGSTGAHRKQFEEASDQFATLARSANVQMEGQVIASAVQDNTDSSATVLVVTESSVTNSNTPEPSTESYRLRITVDKVDGVCKTSNIEYVY